MASCLSSRSRITIRTLGAFSVQQDGRAIPGLSTPNSTVSRLLMCLLARRQDPFSTEELIALLWPTGRVKDPAKALVALIYRLRRALSACQGRGTDYIQLRQNCYVWNDAAPCFWDAERFESLCRQAQAASAEEEQRALYEQAFALYQGDFLPQKFQPACVAAAASHYRQLYHQIIGRLARLYAAQKDYAATVKMCEAALKIDDALEFIYGLYIDALLCLGQPVLALERYQQMARHLSGRLGLSPSPQLSALYGRIHQALGQAPAMLSAVRANLAETAPPVSAQLCSLDSFRTLYQFACRLTDKSGQIAFLASLSIHGAQEPDGCAGTQEPALRLLTQAALQQLPSDSAVSSYSQTQLLLLLFSLPYEDCDRLLAAIERAFYNEYIGSPVSLSHELAVLEALPPDA